MMSDIREVACKLFEALNDEMLFIVNNNLGHPADFTIEALQDAEEAGIGESLLLSRLEEGRQAESVVNDE